MATVACSPTVDSASAVDTFLVKHLLLICQSVLNSPPLKKNYGGRILFIL